MNLKDLITHLRSLEQKATQGPWDGEDNNLPINLKSYIADTDAELIAEIRNNLVTLLDALEKALAGNEQWTKEIKYQSDQRIEAQNKLAEIQKENSQIRYELTQVLNANESLRTHAQHEQELNHEAQKENALLSESLAECNIYAVDLEKQLSEANKVSQLLIGKLHETEVYALAVSDAYDEFTIKLAEAKDTIIQMSGAIDIALNTVDVPGAREHVGIGLENAAFKARTFLDKCKE